MKFSDLLTETVRNAEIPLRFEPGAEEAIVEPVTDLLKHWVAIHDPDDAKDEFDYGQRALVLRLLEELDGQHELPVAGDPSE